MLIGAIADDLTGATDLCLTLSREGMETVQVIGVPGPDFDFGNAQAVVVALKSRTIPADDAVRQSLDAAAALLSAGARQLIFKYCSTFDSTPAGNIGPVTEALMDLLDTPLTIACPAFPANGRTVYCGHLFIGDTLLSESPMKDHPLTPMRDANLVRVLQQQTSVPVGLLGHHTVDRGREAISTAFRQAASEGKRILIVDAVTDIHLRSIGAAVADMKLITGGSGIAIGLPANFRRSSTEETRQPSFTAPEGRAVILAGSCSTATRRQITAAITAGVTAIKVDPAAIAAGKSTASAIIEAIVGSSHPNPLVYSSAEPDEVNAAQAALGRERAGELVEHFLSEIAKGLRDRGFRRFIIAGGETSGAVVNALNIPALRIGPEIDPGIPWTLSLGEGPQLALALKSGNFGADDFFLKAWELLE
jgi:uncharacterized protein YgbK (DUF1537 family)